MSSLSRIEGMPYWRGWGRGRHSRGQLAPLHLGPRLHPLFPCKSRRGTQLCPTPNLVPPCGRRLESPEQLCSLLEWGWGKTRVPLWDGSYSQGVGVRTLGVYAGLFDLGN